MTVAVEHYTLYTVRACSSLLHASVGGGAYVVQYIASARFGHDYL